VEHGAAGPFHCYTDTQNGELDVPIASLQVFPPSISPTDFSSLPAAAHAHWPCSRRLGFLVVSFWFSRLFSFPAAKEKLSAASAALPIFPLLRFSQCRSRSAPLAAVIAALLFCCFAGDALTFALSFYNQPKFREACVGVCLPACLRTYTYRTCVCVRVPDLQLTKILQ